METVGIYLVVIFACGFLARVARLPTLVGYLAAGFILHAPGIDELPIIDTMAELGVTILLFTIGLKLDVRVLLRREVWFTATAHMLIFTVVGAGLLKLFMLLGLPFLDGLPWPALLIIGFAFSYSSTVLVVKVLEDRGESQAFYGRVAIGVLVLQDIAAVAFIVAETLAQAKIAAEVAPLLDAHGAGRCCIESDENLHAPGCQDEQCRNHAERDGGCQPGLRDVEKPAKHEGLQLPGLVAIGQTDDHADAVHKGQHHGRSGFHIQLLR